MLCITRIHEWCLWKQGPWWLSFEREQTSIVIVLHTNTTESWFILSIFSFLSKFLWMHIVGSRTSTKNSQSQHNILHYARKIFLNWVSIFPNEWSIMKRFNRIQNMVDVWAWLKCPVNLDCQGCKRRVPLTQKAELNHEVMGYKHLETSKLGSSWFVFQTMS